MLLLRIEKKLFEQFELQITVLISFPCKVLLLILSVMGVEIDMKVRKFCAEVLYMLENIFIIHILTRVLTFKSFLLFVFFHKLIVQIVVAMV